MAVSIIEQIISSTNANRPGGNYTKSYITIHETGNKDAGAGAKNHANWLSNGANGEIGYHYTVDDHEIYHHIPDNEKAWHAGDGGLGTGNLHSSSTMLLSGVCPFFAEDLAEDREPAFHRHRAVRKCGRRF